MEAGVVDQDIDAAPTLGNLRTGARDRRRIGHVGDQADGLAADRLRLRIDIRTARDQRNAVTLARGQPGDREAQASRCPGDHPSAGHRFWRRRHPGAAQKAWVTATPHVRRGRGAA